MKNKIAILTSYGNAQHQQIQYTYSDVQSLLSERGFCKENVYYDNEFYCIGLDTDDVKEKINEYNEKLKDYQLIITDWSIDYLKELGLFDDNKYYFDINSFQNLSNEFEIRLDGENGTKAEGFFIHSISNTIFDVIIPDNLLKEFGYEATEENRQNPDIAENILYTIAGLETKKDFVEKYIPEKPDYERGIRNLKEYIEEIKQHTPAIENFIQKNNLNIDFFKEIFSLYPAKNHGYIIENKTNIDFYHLEHRNYVHTETVGQAFWEICNAISNYVENYWDSNYSNNSLSLELKDNKIRHTDTIFQGIKERLNNEYFYLYYDETGSNFVIPSSEETTILLAEYKDLFSKAKIYYQWEKTELKYNIVEKACYFKNILELEDNIMTDNSYKKLSNDETNKILLSSRLLDELQSYKDYVEEINEYFDSDVSYDEFFSNEDKSENNTELLINNFGFKCPLEEGKEYTLVSHFNSITVYNGNADKDKELREKIYDECCDDSRYESTTFIATKENVDKINSSSTPDEALCSVVEYENVDDNVE